MKECDNIIDEKPVERIIYGERLLRQSRECFRRVFYLSYAWRITNDDKYLKRATKELLAVSRFTDWHPSHFLDVAELTTAVSIGYDWLYNGLSDKDRKELATAILEKGLNPSLDTKYNYVLKRTNNWNQVCNTGMANGALVSCHSTIVG